MVAFNIWMPQTLLIEEMNGLDYGTGLAYSYYYGYLRIILPSTGTAVKGLQEKLQNFEDTHNITFAIQKLLILIPASAYIPTDLKEASYQWMESIKHLEEEKRDRAGVKGRQYHNSAYKIYPGGYKSNVVPQYVLVEGATPMLTLFEVIKHSHPESYIYKMQCKEIVKAFYKKLQDLLDNDPECRDLCELIYYDDYDSKGVKVNIAKIILNRLSTLKENS
ncbi:hypothetical protein KM043_015202 [Ampulex compressa]|nr:hypothetical protein KM043_015202 [Ampulex compressa]